MKNSNRSRISNPYKYPNSTTTCGWNKKKTIKTPYLRKQEKLSSSIWRPDLQPMSVPDSTPP